MESLRLAPLLLVLLPQLWVNRVYVSIHALIRCIFVLEEVYPVLQAPCKEPFQAKAG